MPKRLNDSFTDFLDVLRVRYPNTEDMQRHGQFDLLTGIEIKDALDENNVPKMPGVYLYYAGLGCYGKPLYMGLGGGLKWGSGGPFWKDGAQGLYRRMKNRGTSRCTGKPIGRDAMYKELIEDGKYNGLSFRWFQVYDGVGEIRSINIPQYVEVELFAAYYDAFGLELPAHCKKFGDLKFLK